MSKRERFLEIRKFDLPDHTNTAIIRFAQSGRGAARLARLHGVQEVGGSNPLAPTAQDEPPLWGGFILTVLLPSYPMDSNEELPTFPLNPKSILSLVFAVLTLLTFCTGWLPIPLTGVICFPSSFLLGILALIYGTVSLRQIRQRNESGHPMAWTGIIIGGFVFVCVLCMLIAIISIFIYSPDIIPLPSFIQDPQI